MPPDAGVGGGGVKHRRKFHLTYTNLPSNCRPKPLLKAFTRNDTYAPSAKSERMAFCPCTVSANDRQDKSHTVTPCLSSIGVYIAQLRWDLDQIATFAMRAGVAPGNSDIKALRHRGATGRYSPQYNLN